MPNQNNFRSDVTTTTDVTYLASRIVRIPTEEILLEQLPGSFGYDTEDNVEIHFYTVPINELVLSTVVRVNDSDILKFHIVSYEDNTYKTYLRIDFTKLFESKNLVLLPGDYRMILNFFSDEIGNYDNRKMSIINISDSRTEVELAFNDSNTDVGISNQFLLKEFVEKAFTRSDAVGVAEKIFKSGVTLDDSTEGVMSQNIIENIEISIQGEGIEVPMEVQTFDTTIARIERLNLRPMFEEQLNDFVLSLYPKIREEIVLNSDERIQEAELQAFFRKIVEQHIINLRQTVDSRIKIR